MADFIFNISKGAFAEKVRDGAANLAILLLSAAEVDDTLNNYDDIAALLGAAGNTEATFTNYARKTGITGTLTVDDTNNRVDLDIPDQTWPSAGNGTNNTLTDLLVFYDEGGTDATRIPTTNHDFEVTTDGSDLTAQVDAAGIARAS